MGTNRILEAVARYERVAKQAAQDYEDTLRAAESDLKDAISSSSSVPGPPNEEDVVTMRKDDYLALQEQLKVVAKFVKEHPELR